LSFVAMTTPTQLKTAPRQWSGRGARPGSGDSHAPAPVTATRADSGLLRRRCTDGHGHLHRSSPNTCGVPEPPKGTSNPQTVRQLYDGAAL
jgi:hypothetical protein